MREHLAALLANPDTARRMAAHGRQTILERHTCAHRVDELLRIVAELDTPTCHSKRAPRANAPEDGRLSNPSALAPSLHLG
jgi:spore maturation protein CgeB